MRHGGSRWHLTVHNDINIASDPWYDDVGREAVANADLLSAEQLHTQSSPMMLVQSCGLVRRCYVWKERFIGVMSLKVREMNRERCGSPSTSWWVMVRCKPNPATLPMTSTASSTKSRRFTTLLWMIQSRHTIQCHLAACLDTSSQLTVLTSSNWSCHYLISSVIPIRCQPGYLKLVPAIWHPFSAGYSMRHYFHVCSPRLSSQRMLRWYWRTLTWLKIILRTTNPFWTCL